MQKAQLKLLLNILDERLTLKGSRGVSHGTKRSEALAYSQSKSQPAKIWKRRATRNECKENKSKTLTTSFFRTNHDSILCPDY